MGSDSRTATATSSKPRPSWRNRHLSQLSDEQLNDVKKHRAGKGSASDTEIDAAVQAAQLAGIDSMETPAVKQEAGLPRRQAGPERESPDRESGYATRYEREVEERSQHRQERHPRREKERSDSRGQGRQSKPRNADRAMERNRHDDRQRHPGRHADNREPVRRGERSGGEVYRERDDHGRSGQGRRSPVERLPEHRGKARHRSDAAPAAGPMQRRDAATAKAPAVQQPLPDKTSPEKASSAKAPAEKSIVNKLLDFKLRGPVKYGLMALAIAAMIAVSLMKPIDNSSQSQLDSALTRAMIGFGLARTLNGVISVAQGTEFAVQPAGVGVNFSPGEILDPINDLVERFSWVMLLATSSLGVQKILLEVSSWAGISVLLGGAGLFFLLTRMRNSSMAKLADIAGKLLLVMILVRFLIPVGSLANDWVYKQFLQPQYEESSEQLEIASTRIREISARQTQAEENDGSLKERAKSFYNSMTSKFDFDGMLNDYKDSAENVSEHAISLIVVFMLQTVVFPLLFLYLIYRLFRSVLLPSRS